MRGVNLWRLLCGCAAGLTLALAMTLVAAPIGDPCRFCPDGLPAWICWRYCGW